MGFKEAHNTLEMVCNIFVCLCGVYWEDSLPIYFLKG